MVNMAYRLIWLTASVNGAKTGNDVAARRSPKLEMSKASAPVAAERGVSTAWGNPGSQILKQTNLICKTRRSIRPHLREG